MSKKESEKDAELRALFYKMKRLRLGSVWIPILSIAYGIACLAFSEKKFTAIIFIVCAVIIFINCRQQANRIENKIIEKGNIPDSKKEKYTLIFNKTWRKTILLWVIIIAVLFFVLYGSRNNHKKKEDVWDKDPNEWTESEKEYVDNFFEWQKEQSKK